MNNDEILPRAQGYVRLFYILKGLRSQIQTTYHSISKISGISDADIIQNDEDSQPAQANDGEKSQIFHPRPSRGQSHILVIPKHVEEDDKSLHERKHVNFVLEVSKDADNDCKELYEKLLNQIKLLLNCTLGMLYLVANEAMQNIHTILTDEKISKEAYRAVKKVMKAILTITQYFSLVQVGKQLAPTDEISTQKKTHGNHQPKKRKRTEYSSNNSEDDTSNVQYIVCRICDKKVRADLIKEHTISCMNAYRSETKVASINNELLEFQKNFVKAYLSDIWPGDRERCVNVTLPILHASLLLNRAYEIDPRNADSAYELEAIAANLKLFTDYNLDNDITSQILKLRQKVNEKKYACNAIRRAGQIMKETRLDNSDEPDFSITTKISDFQFIKRISSGAFARVYLAKKKATGDIYAIKVQPKEDVIQKNQVKRVLAEKNILLEFNNPYIINFCMYIFFLTAL